MYDPKDCTDLNELRNEVLLQRNITKDLQTDYKQLREQLDAAQKVITEYRQENEAQAKNIHELAERARIAEALNVQGRINFAKLQEHHKIISDGIQRAWNEIKELQAQSITAIEFLHVVHSRAGRIVGVFTDTEKAKVAEDMYNAYIGQEMVKFNGASTQAFPTNKIEPIILQYLNEHIGAKVGENE